MLKMIKGIYCITTNDVITGDGISESFETGNGVRQGCPLSPTLFNIALDDVDDEWERKKIGGTVIGRTKIYALKYADILQRLRKVQGSWEKCLSHWRNMWKNPRWK